MDEFLRRRLGAEPIDDLELTPSQKEAKRADYFLDDRHIVVEVKTLMDDRVKAMSAELRAFSTEPDWPKFSGKSSLNELAALHPRVAELHRRIFERVTASVRTAVLGANEQIGATAKAFGLTSPMGVVLVLNDDVDLLDPGNVAWAVANAIKARRADGSRELMHIDTAIVISWAHTIAAYDGKRASPIIRIAADDDTPEGREAAFENWFTDHWAAFLGHNVECGGSIESPTQLGTLGIEGNRRLPPFDLDRRQ